MNKRIYTSILLAILCIVAVSGCTSDNSGGNNSQYKNYSGKQMTFLYPSEWILNESASAVGTNDNNLSVRLNKGSSEIVIQVFPGDSNNDTMTQEKGDTFMDGYTFKGTTTIGSVEVFKYASGENIVYLFKRGDKTFEMLGSEEDITTMNKVVETSS